MRNFIVYSIFVLLFSTMVSAGNRISDSKKVLIDILLEQSGQSPKEISKQFSGALINQMSTSMKRARPDIDPKAFKIVEEVVKSQVNDEIVNKKISSHMMYPIYDKSFTENDLKQIIKFNKTKLGQKLLKAKPIIGEERMRVAQVFGKKLVLNIQNGVAEKLKAAGIK